MKLKYNWTKKRWENVKNWDYPGPRYVWCWREAVPKWERDFCAIVGQVPWPKLVEIKSMFQDPKILEWKDSAVKETFEKEKARYRANINGQPCNTPLPDLDLFIGNEIDWNSSIDPELLHELEEARNPLTDAEEEDEEDDEPHPVFDLNGYLNIKATGWGSIDEEEEEEEQTQAKAADMPLVGSQVLDYFQGEPIIRSTGIKDFEVKDTEKRENPVKTINPPRASAQNGNSNGNHYQILDLHGTERLSIILKQPINSATAGRKSLEEEEIPKTTYPYLASPQGFDSSRKYVCKQVLGLRDEDEAEFPSGFLKFEPLIIPSGWGQEKDRPKTTIPNSGPQGCEEINGNDNSLKQNTIPFSETAKEDKWQNGENSSWKLEKEEKFGGPGLSKGRTRGNNGRRVWINDGNRNYRRKSRGNSCCGRNCMQIWVPAKGKVAENWRAS